jgi:hypothetical protein
MGMTSSSGSSRVDQYNGNGSAGPSNLNGSGGRLMPPLGAEGGIGLGYGSPLDGPWELPLPTRSAPQPPTPGGMTPGGLSVQSGWDRDGVSPGQGMGRGNKSAGSSPNPNRFSQSFGKASVQGDTGSSNGTGGSNMAQGGPPMRPSRAGTMPLLDSHTGLSAINTSVHHQQQHHQAVSPSSNSRPTSFASPMIGTPHSALSPNPSQGGPSAFPPVPGYHRAPASSSMLTGSSSANGGGPLSSSTAGGSLQPPQLVHQPFSAPGNPYASEDVQEDKELPDKPKNRERSGTKSSTKDGKEKKGVFGFMTGEVSLIGSLIIDLA